MKPTALQAPIDFILRGLLTDDDSDEAEMEMIGLELIPGYFLRVLQMRQELRFPANWIVF
jgi:hypothetical protein